jgi:glutamate synthase (NADPH/NADH) large chain
MYEGEQYHSNHAACGVGLLVNISNLQYENPAQHQLAREALEILANFEYRSGINPSTDECDGAGIRFFGLPTLFFNRLLRQGHFEYVEQDHSLVLSDSQYAIGHYFFPNDLEKVLFSKERIQQLAQKHSLKVLAWRDLGANTVDSLLSKNCLEKKPAIWQAIIVSSCADYSSSLNHLFIDIYHALPEVHILSQSTDSMVFKGMIKPSVFKNYFTDFSAPDFVAKAAIMHGRFATNTNPQWKNAQPCNHFIAHNGEFNSAPANLIEMKQELDYHNIEALIPQIGMSDSLQFDYDLFNQLIIHQVSLIE